MFRPEMISNEKMQKRIAENFLTNLSRYNASWPNMCIFSIRAPSLIDDLESKNFTKQTYYSSEQYWDNTREPNTFRKHVTRKIKKLLHRIKIKSTKYIQRKITMWKQSSLNRMLTRNMEKEQKGSTPNFEDWKDH